MELVVAVIMYAGLYSMLLPKFPGSLIILGAAALYGWIRDFENSEPWLWWVLIGLALLADGGSRLIRYYQTKPYRLSRRFSVNATAGNVAGMITADVAFGPVLGVIIWQLVAGKTYLPRWSTTGKIMAVLIKAALFRLSCGIVMIILVITYLF